MIGLQLAIAALLLLLTNGAQAHLKLYYTPFRLPIRNAPGPSSDGLFSAATNQPCGGRNDWGRNNQRRYATQIVDGQRVCARVNWNGGHSTTLNENKLRAVFRCNRPSNPRDFLDLKPLVLANGTNPPPDEFMGSFVSAPLTNQVYDGYTVCVDLPPQGLDYTVQTNINDPARQCSLSIMEGNGWGGCLDILLKPKYADSNMTENKPYDMLALARNTLKQDELNENTKPVGRDYNILEKSEGTYRIDNCLTDTGGKCCLIGYFAVLNNGAVSARLMGSGPQSVCFDLAYYGYRDYQMILEPSKFDAGLFSTNFYLHMGRDEYDRPVSVQNMSLSMRDGGSLVINNVGFDIPEVSDHDAVFATTLNNGLDLGYIPVPNYSTVPDYIPWEYIIPGIVGGLVVLWLGWGLVKNTVDGGPCCQHPHIHALLVNCGCVRKRRRHAGGGLDEEAFSLQLPANWYSAVDQTSGEVYYYNTVTKETKWDRPTFPPQA